MAEDEEKAICILASGRGSNFGAVAEAAKSGRLRCRISALITDRENTGAESVAERFNLPVFVISYEKHGREKAEELLLKKLNELNPDFIVAAGFMKILPEKLVGAFKNRILNIHPSLLPAFPGINAQKQAVEYGVKITGCTVHFVDSGVDTGPILLQKSMEVAAPVSAEQLSSDLLKLEHEALVESVEIVLNKKILIEGRRVLTE